MFLKLGNRYHGVAQVKRVVVESPQKAVVHLDSDVVTVEGDQVQPLLDALNDLSVNYLRPWNERAGKPIAAEAATDVEAPSSAGEASGESTTTPATTPAPDAGPKKPARPSRKGGPKKKGAAAAEKSDQETGGQGDKEPEAPAPAA
jgi:hypothetical protein